MEPGKAKLLLMGLKRQVRQREVYEALDLAIETLAWREVDEKKVDKEVQDIIDLEDKGISLGEK